MLVLVIPIGIPGVGKTTLGIELQRNYEKNIKNKVFISSRDKLYKECKLNRFSRKKTKLELQNKLDCFIKKIKIYENENPSKNILVYMDSSNTFKAVRDKIIFKIKPCKIIYLNFKVSHEEIYLLYERLKLRQGHPTFPEDIKEHKRIVENIAKGIEYSSNSENILNLNFTSTIESHIENILKKIQKKLLE